MDEKALVEGTTSLRPLCPTDPVEFLDDLSIGPPGHLAEDVWHGDLGFHEPHLRPLEVLQSHQQVFAS